MAEPDDEFDDVFNTPLSGVMGLVLDCGSSFPPHADDFGCRSDRCAPPKLKVKAAKVHPL